MVPIRPRISVALGHQPLGIGDRACRVEPFRAGLGAVHDGVAAVETERVLEPVEALAGPLVAAVGEPAIGLTGQDSGLGSTSSSGRRSSSRSRGCTPTTHRAARVTLATTNPPSEVITEPWDRSIRRRSSRRSAILSDILYLQDGRSICAGLAAGVCILSEIDPVCRNDLH